MLLRFALLLTFVAACGGSASAIGNSESAPMPSGSGSSDPSSDDADSPPWDSGYVAMHDGASPNDGGPGGPVDSAAADAGFCGYAVSFTLWSVSSAQGLHAKGGICIPSNGLGVPNCAAAAPCGCFNAVPSSSALTPFVFASTAGDVVRMNFDTSVVSGYACP